MGDEETRLLHVWSGPRSLSTCMMYSFSRRPDCTVYDEPLYASYLAANPSLFRPYREQLLNSQKNNGDEVLRDLLNPTDTRLKYAKHIAKQFHEKLDKALLFGKGVRHLILIRDPIDMVASWENKREVHHEDCSLENSCLPKLVTLFSKIREETGVPPIVIDVDLFLENESYVLEQACKLNNLLFYPEQLFWPAGPKPEIDGLWASYWYDEVHMSTGFHDKSKKQPLEVRQIKNQQLTPLQLSVYRECLPFYQMLRRYAIGNNIINPGSSISELSLLPDNQITITRLSDSRNADILIWVGNKLLPREMAKVSVFDSSVQGGDAVWEGLRVYHGKIFKLEEHLSRLMSSAKAMDFKRVPSLEYIRNAIYRTLSVNGMSDGVHIRLTLTRGPKITSSMNPTFNIFGCTLLIVPEWKPVGDVTTYNNNTGVTLITATNRRNSPQCVDSKIHHNNLINNILPKIQANYAGAADALMLDVDGFVAETNATNIFLVKSNVVVTPTADYCLPGVTRETVMSLVTTVGLELQERRVSLAEFHAADEIFTTGTMGELTPIVMLDGRSIGDGKPGNVTALLQREYRSLVNSMLI